jgi:hypothetical protein
MESPPSALDLDATDNFTQMDRVTEISGLKSLQDEQNNNPKIPSAQDSNFSHVDNVKTEPESDPPTPSDETPQKERPSAHTARVDRIREGLESAIRYIFHNRIFHFWEIFVGSS